MTMTLNGDLADKIKLWRREEGLSQQDLGAFLGVSQRTVSRWERGVDRPSAGLMERLCGLIEGGGKDSLPAVFESVRSAVIPLALIDGNGRILIASDAFPHSQLPKAQPTEKCPLVLVVEDDLAVLKATRAALKRWHYLSVGVSGGEEAVTLVASGELTPEAALIDFKLPGVMDGVDTAIALRRHLPELPVLIVTGEGRPENMRRIGESGLSVITKPVNPQQVRLALKAMLSARHAR
jgi:CheY-like chemotaxis protein